jgi:hypothetical protein
MSSIEANRHDAMPAPFDHRMPSIARVDPREFPLESNSPPPQFPSVAAFRSGYAD